MRDPDVTGAYARLWETRIVAVTDHAEPTLRGYLMHAPLAHPAWAWHVMYVIHLRPCERHGEATLFFPGATHEVMVLALHPDHDDELDPDDHTTWHILRPPDAVVQVILADDQQAVELLGLAAAAISVGLLVPDSDHRRSWASSLALTAEHIRLGGHPDQESECG